MLIVHHTFQESSGPQCLLFRPIMQLRKRPETAAKFGDPKPTQHRSQSRTWAPNAAVSAPFGSSDASMELAELRAMLREVVVKAGTHRCPTAPKVPKFFFLVFWPGCQNSLMHLFLHFKCETMLSNYVHSVIWLCFLNRDLLFF